MANNDSNKTIHSGTVSRDADSGLRAYENHTFGQVGMNSDTASR